MLHLTLVFRGLFRTPLFTVAAVSALGLAIAAATAVFSVADGTLFRPLPYAEPGRLVEVSATIRARQMPRWDVPFQEYEAWRDASRHLSGLAGYSAWSSAFTLSRPDEPVRIYIAGVTRNFLSVLGVPPALGRDLVGSDFDAGAEPAVVLLHRTWRQVFASDPMIAGRVVELNGRPATVVGVLPDSFAFPLPYARTPIDALMPVTQPTWKQARLTLIGRLAPGSTPDHVTAELDPVAASRRAASGLRDTPIDGAEARWLDEILTGRQKTLMWLLVAAVTSLLFIGCANVTNLLLARGADRVGELALRSALGASRSALVRLLLAESLVLALCAGLVGVLLAWGTVAAVGPLVPADLHRLKTVSIDGRAVFFALGASITCVVLSGLLPAVRSTRRDVLQSLQQSSSRTGTRHGRLRQGIIALEVALATVLVIGGGLMANAMIRLRGLDHGYDAARVLTMWVSLPQRGTEDAPPSAEFVQRAVDAVRRLPAVVAAGAISGSVLDRTMYGGVYRVEGFSEEWMEENADTGSGTCCTTTRQVSPEVFAAFGVPVVRGRAFTSADSTASPRVAIINDRLARKFPAGMNPVGHWLVSYRDPADRRLIVGVVGDIRDMSLEWRPPQAIYLPIGGRGASAMTLVVKTAGDPKALVGPTRRAVQLGAGPVVISNVSTLDDLVLGSVAGYRLNAWLFGSFGAVGLLVAAVGILSVVAYSVAHRTREIGLRLALGATPTAVRRLVARQALAPAVAGLVVGVGAALGLSRFLATFLYEVPPTDMPTYAITSGVLLAVALVAALVPARRASLIDPMLALRAD